jgi:ribosomal protein S18 acetylase RimI-like enzyme
MPGESESGAGGDASLRVARMRAVSGLTTSHVELAKLGPDDWREMRTIRLEALQRDPAAFSSTYAESVVRPDEDWRQRLAKPDAATLVARTRTGPIGMAGAIFGADGERHVALIFGMYVSTSYRGRGVGRMLLRALFEEIAGHPEITTIRLWVTPTQQAARRLYASMGFQVVENPDRSMLDGPGANEEVAMELAVVR